MKKVALILLLLISTKIHAQTVTGWHIVTNESEWGMLAPSAEDLSDLVGEGGSLKKEVIDDYINNPSKYIRSKASLNKGELVFVINKIKDVYYCYSIPGRIMAVKGKLYKVEGSANTGIGLMNEHITLLNGEIINCDYVWVVGQDIAKQTLTIQYSEGEKLEIPQSKCDLINPALVNAAKDLKYKKVE